MRFLMRPEYDLRHSIPHLGHPQKECLVRKGFLPALVKLPPKLIHQFLHLCQSIL